MGLNTDRLRAYAHGVWDKRVSIDDPHRRVLPVDRFVGLAVDDLRRAAAEIDHLRALLAERDE